MNRKIFMTLVTTITRFKAKIGFEDQLIDALRKFDNSNSISWQILSLGDSEYAALNTYESIEDRSMDVVSGLDWLDSITPILELYEKESGKNITNPVFYYVFGLFKIAVIAQQIYFRYKKGYTKDRRFSLLNLAVMSLSVMAKQAIVKNRLSDLFE